MEVVASLSQSRKAAAQCGLFTHKSVPVIFEPPCISRTYPYLSIYGFLRLLFKNALHPQFIHGRRWMNIIQVSSFGGKTVIRKYREQ